MEWLDEQGIEYEEIDANSVPEKHITAVPLIEIGDTIIEGFNRPAIKEALANLDQSDDAQAA